MVQRPFASNPSQVAQLHNLPSNKNDCTNIRYYNTCDDEHQTKLSVHLLLYKVVLRYQLGHLPASIHHQKPKFGKIAFRMQLGIPPARMVHFSNVRMTMCTLLTFVYINFRRPQEPLEWPGTDGAQQIRCLASPLFRCGGHRRQCWSACSDSSIDVLVGRLLHQPGCLGCNTSVCRINWSDVVWFGPMWCGVAWWRCVVWCGVVWARDSHTIATR